MGFLNALRTTTSSIRQKLFTFPVEQKGWEELRAGIQTVGGNTTGTLAPTVESYQALKKFRSWVYPVVSLISRKVTTVPHYLYQRKNRYNREAFERVVDHPIIKLLEHPNDFLSGRQLREIIQLHLDLCGVAYARIVRNGAGQPKQLLPYFPHELVRIELGTTSDTIIKGFHFSPLNNRQNPEFIPYRDMLYFHYPHPMNPYLPFTPLQALWHVTDIDLHLQTYTKSFFENGARPDFVIIPEKQIGRVAAERVSEGWMARFRGPGKSFKPAVLSDSVKIQQLSMSARDFEFLSMSGWIQDHILAAFGVPKSMLGLMGEANRSASLNAETVFVNNCIQRRLDLFADVINSQLVPQYRNLEGYQFDHATALPKDSEWETAKDQSDLSMGKVTLNEVRRREGDKPYRSKLADVPWVGGQPLPGCDEDADKLWKESTAPPQMPGMPGAEIGTEAPVEMNNLPEAQGAHGVEGGRPTGTTLATLVQDSLRTSRPNLSMLLNASRGKRGGLAALLEAHPEVGGDMGSLLLNDRNDSNLMKLFTKGIRDYLLDEYAENEQDRAFLEIYEEIATKTTPLEEDFEKESERFFVAKGIEIAGIVKKMFGQIVTKEIEFDIDENQLREDYIEQTAPFVIKAVTFGLEAGYRMVQKAGGETKEPDVHEREAFAAAGKFLSRSADLKVKSTRKALVKIIREGIEEGLGSDEVADMIQKRFEWIGAQRASMIARTELSGAVNAGQDAAFEKINKDAGKIVVKESRRLASIDERLCKECKAKNGNIIKDYVIGKQHEEATLHPNCRCGLQPVLNKESRD